MAATTVYGHPTTTEDFPGIEQDRWKAGRHFARVVGGPRVWLIIATLKRLDGDVEKAAREWDLSPDQVRCAIDYNERNTNLIDAQILLANEEETA